MTDPNADPNVKLRELDREIADVTRDLDDLRDQLSEGGALEPEERAAILTNREELEGVLEGLGARRGAVQKQIDQS